MTRSLGVIAMAGTFALLVSGSSSIAAVAAFAVGGGYAVAWSLLYPAYHEVTPPAHRTRALAELAPVFGKTVAPLFAGWLHAFDPEAPLRTALLLTVPVLAVIAWVSRELKNQRRPAPQPAALTEELV